MGKISEIFNFDNIGGKIKSLAKWSCWITILLIWIAAPILFFVFVSDRHMEEFCWIPLVSAIVGPAFIWVGSWTLYAFGELVEKTSKNEDHTAAIEALLQKSTKETKRNPSQERSTSPVKNTEPSPQPNNPSENPIIDPPIENILVCSTCARKNAISRKYCWFCDSVLSEKSSAD